MSKFIGEYPPDWNDIQLKAKQRANWQCERCFRVNDPEHGYTLTVHHLDNDKSNCNDWNLAVLCQRCHLHIQGKVEMKQIWMFEHTGWMKPHVKGYLESLKIQQGVNLE